VQAVWLECKVDRSTADTQELCRKPVEATDLQLRILSAPIRNQYRDTVFGFMVNPVLASVFYDYVVRFAKEDDAQLELPIVLGCVIAHEIGHLLIGADSHSGSGLMQRQWRRESVRKAMTGSLLFSAEESEVIRAEARRRCGYRRLASRSMVIEKSPVHSLCCMNVGTVDGSAFGVPPAVSNGGNGVTRGFERMQAPDPKEPSQWSPIRTRALEKGADVIKT
jgi:hypothetical protein